MTNRLTYKDAFAFDPLARIGVRLSTKRAIEDE